MGGHASRDAGRSFEERIKNALVVATQQGIVAWWAHQEPAYTRFGVPLKDSGADFVLVLKGGLAGAIECKSTKTARLMWDAVAHEQARHLDATHRAGGLALLAAEFREETGIHHSYLVPWDRIPWEKARTALSVTADALEKAGYGLQSSGSIARHLQSCVSCGAYHPIVGTKVCCRASAPF